MRNAEAAEKSGNLAAAYREYQQAASLGATGAAAKVARMRGELIARAERRGREATARLDFAAAVQAWSEVLSYDPTNANAALRKQEAQTRLDKLK